MQSLLFNSLLGEVSAGLPHKDRKSSSLPNMQKAETCLRLFREQFPKSAPKGLTIQYLKAYSDLHYRKDNLEKAVRAAEYSLKIAKKYQFNTEIGPLKERIESYSAKSLATLWNDTRIMMANETTSGDESAESALHGLHLDYSSLPKQI